MDIFLAHCLVLLWMCLGAARPLAAHAADRLLAAALLAWGNVVATCLLLSTVNRLGHPGWFFSTSGLLAGLTCLLLLRFRPAADPTALPAGPTGPGVNPRLWFAFIVTIAPLALAGFGVAYTQHPDSPDALAYQLPRALYYLGQNSLAHFDATDPRQVWRPFNDSLLRLLALVYHTPLPVLNFFNLAAWALSGGAVYRLCRLCAVGANASLLTSWLVLTATPVIASAASITIELPAGAALLGALVFGLQWWQTQRASDAALAGLAVGLAAGSSLNILLFCSGAGLLFGIRAYRQGRSEPVARTDGSRRMWIMPALLAGAAGAPFALINLAEAGRASGPGFGATLFRLLGDAPPHASTGPWPLFAGTAHFPVLTVDTVNFGFTGALFLLCAFLCLWRFRQSAGPVGWFAGLGLGWILVIYSLQKWILPNAPDFVPGVLLLSPCVAATIEANQVSRTLPRLAGRLILLVVVLAAAWSAGRYLLRNPGRPFTFLSSIAAPPPAWPALPLLVKYRLANQAHLNVDTDGVDECIFPFLALGSTERFTSSHTTIPAAYNLLSRAGDSRNAAYLNTGRLPSYALLSIPDKRSAGVEFLGRVGAGAASRDYFGLESQAGRTASLDSNRTLLITIYPETAGNGPGHRARLTVAGLNAEDQLWLAANLENVDGTVTSLAAIKADGATPVAISQPFKQLVFRAHDNATQKEMGAAAIPYNSLPVAKAGPVDLARPTSDSSLFVIDGLQTDKSGPVTVKGLLPVEGPFPQWDLPFLRWQRQPAATIRISATGRLARLQVSFSVRLHVRNQGGLDVVFNGERIQHYRIEDRTTWLDQTLELTPRPGENVLEFKDAPIIKEQDWMDYLERYPDVMKHVVTNHLPLEQGAREHYEQHGRAEGRILQMTEKPEPTPGAFYFMYRHLRLEGFKSP